MATPRDVVDRYIEKLQMSLNTPLTEEFGQYRVEGGINCHLTLEGCYKGYDYWLKVHPPSVPVSVPAFKFFNHIIRGATEEITEEDLEQDRVRERMLQDQITYVKRAMRQFEQEEGVVVDNFYPYENYFGQVLDFRIGILEKASMTPAGLEKYVAANKHLLE